MRGFNEKITKLNEFFMKSQSSNFETNLNPKRSRDFTLHRKENLNQI